MGNQNRRGPFDGHFSNHTDSWDIGSFGSGPWERDIDKPPRPTGLAATARKQISPSEKAKSSRKQKKSSARITPIGSPESIEQYVQKVKALESRWVRSLTEGKKRTIAFLKSKEKEVRPGDPLTVFEPSKELADLIGSGLNRMAEIVDETVANAGIPKVEFKTGDQNMPVALLFDAGDWKIKLHPFLMNDLFEEPEKTLALLLETQYHELQHAQDFWEMILMVAKRKHESTQETGAALAEEIQSDFGYAFDAHACSEATKAYASFAPTPFIERLYEYMSPHGQHYSYRVEVILERNRYFADWLYETDPVKKAELLKKSDQAKDCMDSLPVEYRASESQSKVATAWKNRNKKA